MKADLGKHRLEYQRSYCWKPPHDQRQEIQRNKNFTFPYLKDAFCWKSSGSFYFRAEREVPLEGLHERLSAINVYFAEREHGFRWKVNKLSLEDEHGFGLAAEGLS